MSAASFREELRAALSRYSVRLHYRATREYGFSRYAVFDNGKQHGKETSPRHEARAIAENLTLEAVIDAMTRRLAELATEDVAAQIRESLSENGG